MIRGITSGVIAAALLLAAPALAPAATTTTVQGTAAPGTPPELNQVFVTKFGPAKADRVLVLIPGTIGGAGDFGLVAEDIVDRVPNLQVWAVDRRSQALEDTSMFAAALNGHATPQQAFDYYLGWLVDSSIQPHYQPLDVSQYGFAKDWGLDVELNDVRAVVKKASRKGRSVILGGHSLGASSAVAYATWDFNGRAGYRDIDGLVLIDGGLLGSFDSFDVAQAREQLATLDDQPFTDLLDIGLPWVAGTFVETGALLAKIEPTAPSPAQQFPVLPQQFNPGFLVTNRAELGFALDEDTSPAELGLIHVRAGALAPSGDPRDWLDGEVSPIARVADFFAQEPTNAVEWYYPSRLNIDVNGANDLEQNAVTDLLGLRPFHTRQVNVPLYAFQTSLTGGHVLNGARALIRRSKIRPRQTKLVDASATTSHLDPLTAAPQTNQFLGTVLPFLRHLGR